MTLRIVLEENKIFLSSGVSLLKKVTRIFHRYSTVLWDSWERVMFLFALSPLSLSVPRILRDEVSPREREVCFGRWPLSRRTPVFIFSWSRVEINNGMKTSDWTAQVSPALQLETPHPLTQTLFLSSPHRSWLSHSSFAQFPLHLSISLSVRLWTQSLHTVHLSLLMRVGENPRRLQAPITGQESEHHTHTDKR